MVEVNQEVAIIEASGRVTRWWAGFSYFVRRYPLGAFGGGLMTLFLLVAVFADFVATHDPTTTNAAVSLSPPNWAAYLGNDFMGRDVFSRIVHGARISLIVGFCPQTAS